MTIASPYVSFVVTSRNDDPGGALLPRMQMFVDGLVVQCNRHHLDAELIIVEWNPPPDRPRLFEAIRIPADTGSCHIRIVEVPPAVHAQFEGSASLPLFQMVGKNTGIRRAHGEFVLATNVDILFSEVLMRFLASKQLRNDMMYRVDRYDVRADIPPGLSVPERLDWCRNNIVRINGSDGTIAVKFGNSLQACTVKKNMIKKATAFLAGRRRFLHTNACGDFTLLAREKWMAVRGYPELRVFALYQDGLLCYAAHFAGAREMRLKDPMRIYHIDHPPRGDGAGRAEKLLKPMHRNPVQEPVGGWLLRRPGLLKDNDIENEGVFPLSYAQYRVWVKQMRRRKTPILFNQDDSWGLADTSLKEWSSSAR